LAAAIANELIGAGKPALFMVVPDLLDHFRAGFNSDDEELKFERLFDQVRNAPVLILDDIDLAGSSEWAREKLLQIINHRYNAELATVCTATEPAERLEQRLATRLGAPWVTNVSLELPGSRRRYREVGGMTLQRLGGLTFANFDLRGAGLVPEERDSLVDAFNAATQFSEEPAGWLTILGTNGCGKTHLAAGIANRCLQQGRSVFFAVVPDLLDHLRGSFSPGRDRSYDELFQAIRAADLVVLDDFGVEAPSAWAQEKLFQLVNYRTVAGLASVVTADRSQDELREAHRRVVSRIFDPRSGTCVAILAPHYSLGRGRERRRSASGT
jgi:DNA replication protein DnaC